MPQIEGPGNGPFFVPPQGTVRRLSRYRVGAICEQGV